MILPFFLFGWMVDFGWQKHVAAFVDGENWWIQDTHVGRCPVDSFPCFRHSDFIHFKNVKSSMYH